MKGFRDFLLRGNLIELAIAFIMGAAFKSVVDAFTQIIMDVIGKIGGNPNFDTVNIGGVNVGVFLTALVSFLIMAAVLYFGIVKPFQAITARIAAHKAQEEEAAPAAPTTEELLTQIRDLLKDSATSK
ncbi:MAG: large conductance mechanosensitive channel protein MscL [Bifidobacteriaceae bacterium]|jgi:large conductance mechanosensitive channel|nr:large conductance mechanosensitive channel protein MscL [Bifidobacteriaceae bacterium]